MKTITATELMNILDQHKLWLESARKQGKQANLEGANLHCAYLKGANLEDATMPEKELIAGKLYDFGTILVCLISINQDATLDYAEAASGEMLRNQPNWHKYSFIEAKE
jgi:uncharacterized protein YjbI with pentapeptide repeats